MSLPTHAVTTSSRALLLVFSDAVPGFEEEYHDWYTNAHLADVVGLEGFRAATRYRAIRAYPPAAPPPELGHLAIYEVDDNQLEAARLALTASASEREEALAAGRQPRVPLSNAIGPRRAHWYRPIMERIEVRSDSNSGSEAGSARALLVSFADAAQGRDDDFNDWYDHRHIPDVLRTVGFDAVERYRFHAPHPEEGPDAALPYLVIYEIGVDRLDAGIAALEAIPAERDSALAAGRAPQVTSSNAVAKTETRWYAPISSRVLAAN